MEFYSCATDVSLPGATGESTGKETVVKPPGPVWPQTRDRSLGHDAPSRFRPCVSARQKVAGNVSMSTKVSSPAWAKALAEVARTDDTHAAVVRKPQRCKKAVAGFARIQLCTTRI